MIEKEVTCPHCDSDYDTIHKMEDRRITIRITYKDKVKEIKVNPWEIL